MSQGRATNAECRAEGAVISALLTVGSYAPDRDGAFWLVKELDETGLRGHHFSNAVSGVLFTDLTAMVEAGMPIDPASVAAELRRFWAEDGEESEYDGIREDVLRCPFRLASDLAPSAPAARWAGIVLAGAHRRGVR
jgi:hypothetical protein